MGRNLVKLGAAIALGGGLSALLTVQPLNIVFLIFAAGVAIALWGLAPELLEAMLSAREREWLEDPEAFLKAHGRKYDDIKHRVARKTMASAEEFLLMARQSENLGMKGLSFELALLQSAVEAGGRRLQLDADNLTSALMTGWTGFLQHLEREGVLR